MLRGRIPRLRAEEGAGRRPERRPAGGGGGRRGAAAANGAAEASVAVGRSRTGRRPRGRGDGRDWNEGLVWVLGDAMPARRMQIVDGYKLLDYRELTVPGEARVTHSRGRASPELATVRQVVKDRARASPAQPECGTNPIRPCGPLRCQGSTGMVEAQAELGGSALIREVNRL